MKKNVFLLCGLLLLALQAASISAQDNRLSANQEKSFTLGKKDEKTFTLELKKDDYAEISSAEKNNRSFSAVLIAPSGKTLLKESYLNGSFPFIALENGVYKLTVKAAGDAENNAPLEIALSYANAFKLPTSAKLQRQRKINGYDAKVYNTNQDDNIATYLLIEKNGKLKAILRSDSIVGGGFQFPDDPKLWDYAQGKRSSALFLTTPDKTGDGTPDLAVQGYSGGAHCCTTMYFFELSADDVQETTPVEGADSDVIAIGKKPQGSLLLKTGDSNFAYWLTSFAGSPIPTVILSYKNGVFRPDLGAMRKPAPSALILRQKAAKAKKNMDLKPYTGEENDSFLDAFWGEMLDLMYSGNETAAWQYFDMVWDKQKPGKEKFKADFLKHLNESEYWQLMQEDKK